VRSPFIVKLIGVQQIVTGAEGSAADSASAAGGAAKQDKGERGVGSSKEGVCAVVYELCSLGSLEDALQCKGKFKHAPIDGVLRFEVLVQACIGLLELHSQGIFHLDLKPANILLDGGREPGLMRARIGDFGMAKAVHKLTSPGAGASGNTTMGAASTRNRTTLWVTEGYACPEYLASLKESDRTDVYAMGISILRVVSGKPVSSALGRLDTLVRRTLKSPNPDLGPLCDNSASWCPKIAEALLRLGLSCVESNPEDRPTVEDLLHSLQEIRDADKLNARLEKKRDPAAPSATPPATPSSGPAPWPGRMGPGGMGALDEGADEGEVVTVTIKVARTSMRLSLRYAKRAM